MRDGFTKSEGRVGTPTVPTWLTSGGNGWAHSWTCSAIDSETLLITNSSLARMLRTVSLYAPGAAANTCRSVASCATMPRSGGVTEMITNWLNGAAFNPPVSLNVVTRAIGRGTTDPVRNL